MILAFDSYYFDDKARTVCIAFHHWTDEQPAHVYTEELSDVEDYVPGAFYKRELPCILSLLKQIPMENIEAIVVDGFVFLNDDATLGLGGHLYNAIEKLIPVIGVAKTNFATLEKKKIALLRGASNRPLYITSVGLDVNTAVDKIKSMHGTFRIPTLLKQLDSLTKEHKSLP